MSVGDRRSAPRLLRRRWLVVGAIVGPGPCAAHEPAYFEPDHAWQREQLVELYEANPATCNYLGDWHTHPNALPNLSALDKATLRRISSHEIDRKRSV